MFGEQFKLMEVLGILLIGGGLGLLSLLSWIASQRNPITPTLQKPRPVPS
jgi:hypothetical protein